MKKTQFWTLLNRFGMPVTLMLLGLILLLNPDSASIVISKVIGWVLTAAGIGYGLFSLLPSQRRVSRFVGAGVCLIVGTVLLASPLLLASHIGRFLGILLAIEGGDSLRKDRTAMGVILLLCAAGLVFAPLTASRLVFSLCGLVVLLVGGGLFLSRLKSGRYPGDDCDSNIIDAL